VSLALLLLACRPAPDPEARRAVRVSMALRGVHPSERELDALLGGEVDLEDLARRWVHDPAFGATVRDLHAEQLLARWDVVAHPPPLGPLADVPAGALAASLDEEPLWLVERIVTEGRPYTQLLTADTTVADRTVALAYGLAFDPAGPALQELPWPDGRPAAGLLSSTGLWQRHMSSDTNYQRVRANLLLARLLCRPLDAGGGGVRFPSVEMEAVRDDPACAACHDVLDPVASAFFGMRRYVLPSEIAEAYGGGCAEGADCYPISLWDPEAGGDWADVGMPPPAWDGEPVADLAELGRRVAAEPEFASCTARRAAEWFGRTDETDPVRVEALAAAFVDGGYDFRDLALGVVLDPEFLDGPPIQARPEQLDRLLPALTGHRLDALPSRAWGPVGLLTNDEHGVRALAGGIDGWNSIRPDPHPSPTAELTWEWAASEGAAAVVASGRYDHLRAEGAVRDELRRLHRAWLAEPEPDLGPSLLLFDDALDRSGDPRHAWTVVLTALLLDDRVVTY
jgi:hypothetical protein